MDLKAVLLDDLTLSVRAANALKNAGYTTVQEVVDLLRREDGEAFLLERTPNFGRTTLHEVMDMAARHDEQYAAELDRRYVAWQASMDARAAAILEKKAARADLSARSKWAFDHADDIRAIIAGEKIIKDVTNGDL